MLLAVLALLLHVPGDFPPQMRLTQKIQMNPLIGPILETKALYAMKLQWDGADD